MRNIEKITSIYVVGVEYAKQNNERNMQLGKEVKVVHLLL